MIRKRLGFTIVELMILVGIISILIMIATPYFVKYTKAARKSACITNMKKIEGAVMLAKMAGVAAPQAADIVGATSHLKKMPLCPSTKQTYTILDPPECPSGDETHVIPPKGDF
jgi:general secretion pathway protein G